MYQKINQTFDTNAHPNLNSEDFSNQDKVNIEKTRKK